MRGSLLMMLWLSVALAGEPKIKIVLVGDSTVATGGGWGTGFTKLLGPDATCVNLARNGSSSKSFRNMGLWTKALDEKPDYILIQFGHNDIPGKGPARETDAATTFPENIGRFVDEARAKGAKPIVVTSVPRRHFKDGKIVCDLVPYVQAVKKVAADKKVPLLDLNARSIERLDTIGTEGSRDLNAIGKDGQPSDLTHFSEKGGAATADWLAVEIRTVVPELASYLKAKE
ncbi:MAG: rhamnogalacturonan acetylesterase [Planctomycetota bacterium]